MCNNVLELDLERRGGRLWDLHVRMRPLVQRISLDINTYCGFEVIGEAGGGDYNVIQIDQENYSDRLGGVRTS